MSSQNIDIYRKLQQHLNKMPVGFPATESGVEIRLLKQLFTPKEAEIAIKLNYTPESLKRIYRRVKKSGFSLEEMEKILDGMASKGSINHGNIGGDKVYCNAFLAIGMYEYQLDRLTEEFVRDFHQYVDEAYLEEFHRLTPQIRVIPIEQSLTPENVVATYNDVRKIVENAGEPIAVAECICKKGQDLIGEPCKQTKMREICFSFRSGAQFYMDMGFARPISKEETLRILKEAEEDGLILQTGNSQKPNFICCCCTCCCGLLRAEKKVEKPAKLVLNNYFAEINPESCTGCGMCVNTCQMDALFLEDGISKVNHDRCIGCGNCVAICPEEAINLARKEEIHVPPKNTYALYMDLIDKKAEASQK
ncbi:MAG: 4Fe-4S dicluster domain-containing protein [Promethearchaeota archaeon]|nr:MAG: 4Fe-4S dicluster domain-containing protein [Candidatus Lokiarchaeota archaeon]